MPPRAGAGGDFAPRWPWRAEDQRGSRPPLGVRRSCAATEGYLGVRRCACCGLAPVWFDATTWCLCERLPEGATLSGPRHECSAARRVHRHAFRYLLAEHDAGGPARALLLACACGQARRVDLSGSVDPGLGDRDRR